MDDRIYIYLVRLPGNDIHEIVLPCMDGYTIYIDERLTHEQQVKAYCHAMRHIKNMDFEKTDVSKIEMEAHGCNHG